MSGKLILAIDQGTHASRAVIFDSNGRVIASAQQPVGLQRRSHTEVEQDAGEIRRSVETVISRVLSAPHVEIAAIGTAGLATQRSSIVAWRRDTGKPLGPVLSWQDRRNNAFIESVAAQQAHVANLTGLRLSPHYGASKMRWLLEHNRAVQEAADSGQLILGPLASWILFHLLAGQPSLVDDANASRTLLWNLKTRNWDDELLELFTIRKSWLPLCKPICADYGTLRQHGIQLRAVNGDQNAALHAQGKPAADTLIVNLGTGAFVLLPTGNGSHRPEGLLAGISGGDAGHGEYYLEGTVNGAGAAVEWAARQLRIDDVQQHTARWLEEVRDPALFLNTVGGLGAPWWQSGPKPGFLTAPESAAQGMVGVLESILFLVQAIIDRLQQHSPGLHTIRISGGLATLDGLCQRLADLSGLMVVRPADTEATARGIAWQAAGCPQHWLESATPETFQPAGNPGLQTRYRRFIQALTALL